MLSPFQFFLNICLPDLHVVHLTYRCNSGSPRRNTSTTYASARHVTGDFRELNS